MRNYFLIILATALVSSCRFGGVSGDGNVVERSHQLEAFNKVKVSGIFDVMLVQSNQSELVIKADQNLHELIEIKVEGQTLIIETSKNISDAEELQLVIHAADFQELVFSGAVNLRNQNVLKGENLNLEVSGAAEIDLELDYQRLSGDFSGAAEVKLKGRAEKSKIIASGASELAFGSFEVEEMELECSGACEANIFVTERLAIDASGAADISYKGNPRIEKSDLSGAASLNSN